MAAGSAEIEFTHADDLPRARAAVVEVCRLMYGRGYAVARDGNVSVRVGDRWILVTPSGCRKGFIGPDALILCDERGVPVEGERGRPSSELAMHLAVYETRPEIRAVVHAHPPLAIAHSVAGVPLSDPLMPEIFCELGEIVTIPYTTPTTREVPDAIRGPIRDHVALILERHGSVTIGTTLAEAYDRLEILEHAAKVSIVARALSPTGISGLNAAQQSLLRNLFGGTPGA